MIDLRIIGTGEWDENLKRSPYQTPFHRTKLMLCFTNVLGGDVSLFACTIEDKSWLVPVFTGAPWQANDKMFTTSAVGYGGPLPLQSIRPDSEERKNIGSVLQAIEDQIDKSFSRGTLFPIPGWECMPENTLTETMLIGLRPNVMETFDYVLSGNARTAVRKAENLGLQTQETKEEEKIVAAHNLISETQKYVGASYVTPLPLLKKILSTAHAKLHIVSINSKIICAGVLLEGKGHAFHWLHGWNREFADTCGNQLLIWSMIKACIYKGDLLFNMGACHSKSQRMAKEKWGAIAVPVPHLDKRSIGAKDDD